MKQQFIGKLFWIALSTVFVAEILSFLTYQSALGQGIILVLIAVLVLCLTAWRMEYGVYLALMELIIGSFGRLFFVDVGGQSLTLRMVIFASVMVVWAIKFLINKKIRKSLAEIRHRNIWLLLLTFIVLGAINGLLNHDLLLVFKDGNAYLYWLYVLPMATTITQEWQLFKLLQILYAGFIWLVAKTIILLYLFTHFGGEVFRNLYIWVRDTRIGEITEVGDGFYRLFFQSYIYIIPIFFLFLAILYIGKIRDRFVYGTIMLSSAIIIVSQSRSIWIGLVIGLIFFASAVLSREKKFKEFLSNTGRVFALTVLSVVLIAIVSMIPLPPGTGASGLGSLTSRATTLSEEAAISRWNLITPLNQKIAERPVLGHGFGAEVEFITQDPRLREHFPDGRVHTYAMEWGWLDMWLEMGLGFVIVMIMLLYRFGQDAWAMLSGDRKWLGLGFFSTIIALAVIHFFTPYLNHPLGIGLVLMIYPFLYQKTAGEAVFARFRAPQVIKPQPKVAPVTSE